MKSALSTLLFVVLRTAARRCRASL
jgi:hypothetical protein